MHNYIVHKRVVLLYFCRLLKVIENKMLNRVILTVDKVKCKYAREQCEWIGQIDCTKVTLSLTVIVYEQ